MRKYEMLYNCLACGSNHLTKYCTLGNQPLANNLKNSIDEQIEVFPLEVNVCGECYHSQLSVAVNKDLLYKHYLYVSGTSDTLIKEFDEVAKFISESNPEAKNVLDIACNDGSFLKAFKKFGLELNGVDPAKNIVESITDPDLNVVCDYFPTTAFGDKKFDIITCFNVVAHIPNPLEFVQACKQHLSPNGTLYIQTSQKDMILNGEFDTIYHEHHSFFNTSSMKHLVERAGLKLDYVSVRPVHGNSYLFRIKHESNNNFLINQIMKNEVELSYLDTYYNFYDKIETNKNRLIDIIAGSKNKVVGYGAAAKAVVMSNYFQIKHEFIVDENPLKIGKVIGGVDIPIVSPETLASKKEDLTIIVYAWNFFYEIEEKIRKLRPNNSDIIVPSFRKM